MAALKVGHGDDRLPLADEEADAGGEREARPGVGLGPDHTGDSALVGFLDIDLEAEPGEEGRGLAARKPGEVGHAAHLDAGARREHDRVPGPGELAGERPLGHDPADRNLAVVETALLGGDEPQRGEAFAGLGQGDAREVRDLGEIHVGRIFRRREEPDGGERVADPEHGGEEEDQAQESHGTLTRSAAGAPRRRRPCR